jgi:hypothetical protein
LDWEVAVRTVERLEWREARGQVRQHELIEVFGALQVLEAVLAKVLQVRACR